MFLLDDSVAGTPKEIKELVAWCVGQRYDKLILEIGHRMVAFQDPITAALIISLKQQWSKQNGKDRSNEETDPPN